jgi:hypothetical protein
MTHSTLNSIEEKLASDKVSVCREALDKAEELMAAGEQTERVRAILRHAAERHRYYTIQDGAKALVARYGEKPDALDELFKPEDRPYIFTATCPKGHVRYYDRRIVCRQKPLDRDTESAWYQLICTHPGCDAKMKVQIDYKDV